MYFYNRKDAGVKLSKLLVKKYKGQDSVVYILPRGGVVTGVEVAKALHAPIDLLITRKIGHPFNPEYALAVLSEDGYIVGNEKEIHQVDQHWFHKEVEKEKQEIKRRRGLYAQGRKKIHATGKIAIIVDDGIATGLTMKQAIENVRRMGPKKIVIAVPVAPKVVAEELRPLVDEIVTIDIEKEYLGAVGAYYREFPQIMDEEVIKLLSEDTSKIHE